MSPTVRTPAGALLALRCALVVAAAQVSTSEGVVLQGRPWRSWVPPHSGCAVGSCKSFKVTPRHALQRMSSSQLHKMKADLGDDVARLEQEVADAARHYSASLKQQGDTLEELRALREEKQQDFDEEQDDHTKKLEEEADQFDGLVDDAGSSSDGAEEERHTLQGLRSSMRSTLWAARGCDLSKCTALAQLLSARGIAFLQAAASGRQANATGDMVKHEQLVREVEALEEKKAKLSGDKQRGMIRYAAAQRSGLDRMDEFERTTRAQDAANMNAKHYLVKKGQHKRKQRGAAKRYAEHQSDVQARLEKTSSALSAKLQKLQTAMGRCKCR